MLPRRRCTCPGAHGAQGTDGSRRPPGRYGRGASPLPGRAARLAQSPAAGCRCGGTRIRRGSRDEQGSSGSQSPAAVARCRYRGREGPARGPISPLSPQLPAAGDPGAGPGPRLPALRGQEDGLSAVPQREEPGQEPRRARSRLLPQKLRGR